MKFLGRLHRQDNEGISSYEHCENNIEHSDLYKQDVLKSTKFTSPYISFWSPARRLSIYVLSVSLPVSLSVHLSISLRFCNFSKREFLRVILQLVKYDQIYIALFSSPSGYDGIHPNNNLTNTTMRIFLDSFLQEMTTGQGVSH